MSEIPLYVLPLALYIAFRIGRRVGRTQGYFAAALLAALADEKPANDVVAKQRASAPWQ